MSESSKKNLLTLAALAVVFIAAVMWIGFGGGEESEFTQEREVVNGFADQEEASLNPSGIEDEQGIRLQSTHVDRQNHVPDEAMSVFQMFQAVESRNIEQLKQLYSPRIQVRVEKKGWDNYLNQIVGLSQHFQRSLDPDDYSIRFVGGSKEGVVHLRSKDGKESNMKVANIEGVWVIDER